MLVKAGAAVESTIDLLLPLLEKGDIIIDGGNEWYENTEHRQKKVAEKGLMYLGMGVSGGEEGARNGVYTFNDLLLNMLLLICHKTRPHVQYSIPALPSCFPMLLYMTPLLVLLAHIVLFCK